MSEGYFSSMLLATATQAVREFAKIRGASREHPVEISSTGGRSHVLLPRDKYDLLSGASGADTGDIYDYRSKFELVMDAVDTRILILDSQLRVRKMNRAVRNFLGLSQEPVGQPARNFVISSQTELAHDRLEQVLSTGRPQRYESASDDDPPSYRSVRIQPWEKGVALFSDDITCEVRYREANEIVDASRAAMSLVDAFGTGKVNGDGTIFDASNSLASLLGIDSARSLEDARFLSMFAVESNSAIEEHLFSTQKPVKIAVKLIVQGTSTRPAELILSPYWSHGSGRSHYFIIRLL